ncbi:ELKS/Rab6-interacting/CAST family member 1-like isoform X1 [Saccostrea echinata]|uniref:ELKS/Rab6-interacting/CAST family member 1-like isoform X1 n=1 Tax=Saccostrea echinata TaxID=191078 RepID=UPI002A83C810|nr:ELKS/Rab6-interacting/CAST family member 1-like isoform X1 [Saccostrea echinata]
MFSKSKKSKEGKVRNGKESPSHGPFSSMTASLPKNIFSGKSRKNSGGYVIADGGSQPSSSKNGQTMGSTEMMARSQTLSHSPGHGYYFEGVSHGGGSPYHSPSNPALSNANLSNAHGSPFSSPSHSGGKTNTLSSVRSLRERYEQESSPQLSDRSLERQIDRLQMLAQSESNPNISPRDFHSYSMSSSFSRERVTDREYPHMGARSLERDHNYPGRSRSMERPDYTTQLYNQEMRNFRDTFILDLEGQIADLSKECAKLHQELDSTKEKLSSSMNSIKTFWSPELKKERALRKEESAKYCLLNEQLKVAQAELKKQASVIQSLESQVSLGEDVQASTRISQQEIEILQREKDKQSKEILILRRTVDEMELRIDIQKQTLAARDESMKKLLEMLQSKGHSISNIQENQLEIESLQAQRLEDERKIKQLQNELSQQLDESAALKEEKNHLSDEVKQLDLQLKQMPASNHTMKAMLEAKDSRIAALEKDVQALEDRIMKNQEDGSDGSVKKETGLKDSLSSREKHLRSEVERLKTELTRKDAEIEGLKLKVDTLTSQQSENQQHITVLKDQVSAKDKQLAMLQTEIDEFIEKLKEKNSTIDKNDQKSQSLQSEKRRIENEVTELREQIETKDRKLTLLQRKIEALEEDLKEKDATISQLKASQSHIENTTTAIATLEETITEKERQIDRLKEQRDRAESEHQEECDLYMKRNHELKAQVDKLQLEITDRQTELCELREKVTEAGSDKFKSETRIKQLEQENREKTEEIQKLKAEVEEKAKAAAEKAVSEESEKKVTELMSQLEKQEEEVKTIKEEVKRSQAVITEMEEDKAKKEKEIAEMQDIIKEYKQKMGTLKRSQQIEKKKNAHLLEEARRREGDLNDDASQLKDAVIAKGDRIEELEEALKESVRITAEREMVMVEQQQQLEEAENKVAELTMELARNKSAENSARVNFLTKQLEDKEQKLKKLQSERHKHLEEVYEMKQEAIQAAMSEKDANIALLEMTSTKQRRNTEEIEKLNREKEKLQQQLKEVTQNRMKLIQKQERRSESLGRSKKSPSHKAKGASPDRVNPYVLTAPASLDS